MLSNLSKQQDVLSPIPEIELLRSLAGLTLAALLVLGLSPATAATLAINSGEGAVIQEHTILDGGSFNKGTLGNESTLRSTVSLDNSGWVTNSGSLINDFYAQLTNSGRLTNYAELTNEGSLNNLRTLTNYIELTNGIIGHLTNSGELINRGSGRLTNDGTLTNKIFAKLTNDGRLINGPIAKLINDGKITNSGSGRLTNEGKLINGSEGRLTNDGTLTNDGEFTLRSGSRLNGDGTFTQSAGRLIVDGTMSQSDIDIDGGSLAGSGTILSDVRLTGAIVSPGSLSFGGNLNLFGGSRLMFELGGVGYDPLDVFGIARIGAGTIFDLDYRGGFGPENNGVYDLLVARSISTGPLADLTFDFSDAFGKDWDASIFTFGDSRQSLRLTQKNVDIVAAVPIPTTLILFLSALFALFGFGQDQNRKLA